MVADNQQMSDEHWGHRPLGCLSPGRAFKQAGCVSIRLLEALSKAITSGTFSREIDTGEQVSELSPQHPHNSTDIPDDWQPRILPMNGTQGRK